MIVNILTVTVHPLSTLSFYFFIFLALIVCLLFAETQLFLLLSAPFPDVILQLTQGMFPGGVIP